MLFVLVLNSLLWYGDGLFKIHFLFKSTTKTCGNPILNHISQDLSWVYAYHRDVPIFSQEAEIDILPVARWFREDTFTYIGVFGSIASPHVLPFYVPNKLMAREIAYQTTSEGGMRKTLKEEKKAIWPTFPLQCGEFALHDLGHAFKEAEIMLSQQLPKFPGRQNDPFDTVKDFTTMVKIKVVSNEEDAFHDIFL